MARTEAYTYAETGGRWLSIAQGPFSVDSIRDTRLTARCAGAHADVELTRLAAGLLPHPLPAEALRCVHAVLGALTPRVAVLGALAPRVAPSPSPNDVWQRAHPNQNPNRQTNGSTQAHMTCSLQSPSTSQHQGRRSQPEAEVRWAATVLPSPQATLGSR